ncbi:MAG: aldehyde reductase [Rhizomicrobium sp.]|nr:aldehyde reductase [Rhizomicrobium sp.]
MSTVLVTGGSGYVAGFCITALLDAGHTVRATLRSLERGACLRATLRREAEPRLTFVPADLTADAGWEAGMTGCDYVLHVASPFPGGAVEDENALVGSARDGTLRVLKAAKETGVHRVVVTSSFGAIGYGHKQQTAPFDESVWTDLNGRDVSPYIKSKTVAEHAAWDFARQSGLELSVINPVGIFGPVLGPDFSASIDIVAKMLKGEMPRVPRLSFGVVDVRDVAALHVTAMTHPAAAGERFLAVSGPALSLLDVARILRAHLGNAAARVPTKEIPDWLLRLLALVKADVREVVPQLGKCRQSTSDKAQNLLGWRPRSAAEAIAATGESLVRLGLV